MHQISRAIFIDADCQRQQVLGPRAAADPVTHQTCRHTFVPCVLPNARLLNNSAATRDCVSQATPLRADKTPPNRSLISWSICSPTRWPDKCCMRYRRDSTDRLWEVTAQHFTDGPRRRNEWLSYAISMCRLLLPALPQCCRQVL